MNILLLSDIHGNFPALQEITQQLPPETFDCIVNCGDSLVYAPFPNKTLQWLQEHKAVSILGNTDKKVIKLLRGKSFQKPGSSDKRIMYTSTAAALSKPNSDYLVGLKKSSLMTLRQGGKDHPADPLSLGIFHGSPAKHHDFLFASTPDSRFRELARQTDCDIVVTGHSHSPYHKTISGTHFINPGSVGRMFDGSPTASCAVLHITTEKILVNHYRFAYPVASVIRRLRQQHLPEIYCEMYRQGRKLN